MGNNSPYHTLFHKCVNIDILIVGLPRSGKKTILHQLQLGKVITTEPATGFYVYTVKHKHGLCTVWDLGSHHELRNLLQQYYSEHRCLIFVIDCSAQHQKGQIQHEFQRVTSNLPPEYPILILANKSDHPRAATPEIITKLLHLTKLRTRPWFVQPTNALIGEGLYEGLQWLVDTVNNPPLQVSASKSANARHSP